MMFTAQLENKGPIAIRYPRGRGTMKNWKTPFAEIEIGKGRIIKEGKDLAIISIGHIGNEVVKACESLEKEGISVTHVDIRFLKPLDNLLLADIFEKFDQIITVEDGTTTGGLGSAVIELISDLGLNKNVVRLGIPDRFIEHGTQEHLWHECGYDAGGIVSTALKLTEKQKVEI
jgi:1-deoxy-D-xylulose-5-phosphate synthase